MTNFATVNVFVPSTEERRIDLDAICRGYEYIDASKIQVVSTGVTPTSASVVLRYGECPTTFVFTVLYDDTDSGDVEFEMARRDDGATFTYLTEVYEYLEGLYPPEDEDNEGYFSFDSLEGVAKEIGVFCICGGH